MINREKEVEEEQEEKEEQAEKEQEGKDSLTSAGLENKPEKVEGNRQLA